MTTSIIVPVLNEAEIIGPFLQHLRRSAPECEIIVADGGSDDATVVIAAGIADQIVRAPRGRASQMNAGARAASGDVFWFLHADSQIHSVCPPQLERALKPSRTIGGCFRLRIPRSNWIYRVSDSLGNAGVSIFGFALGDHGIFCRRADFFAVGGYPEVPLMEDAELYRRLKRRGQMRQLRARIETSPRRYEALGPYRTTFFYLLILVLYVIRAPLQLLADLHRRFTRPGEPIPDSAHAPLLRGASSPL